MKTITIFLAALIALASIPAHAAVQVVNPLVCRWWRINPEVR